MIDPQNAKTDAGATMEPEEAKSAPESKDRPPSKPLTAEEQMALYEDDLKENDWGHQPC